ncbi:MULTISPECIES: LysE family translocator [Halomonadaceae]|uniref:Threonine efflux protein n=1 Tax=Vreelandella titanicae TaxID=664683 RepID=A0AAP9NLY9_9GAMM|nr:MULTISPECIES: LysE family translocator [Halomonas]KIN15236.1 lysine transporter LysE [Halomonas sp. KHS3]QKS24397.1 Threonine efflux protein [Halomonas titanicae]CDG54351.1 LysE-type translocator [Halomonas sp. A3H3]SDI82961.1 Threonine/homoserine/homoserine lactone efflux protein [Halomonas titanicae]|tara:strand:+ start:994 stop:1611 length:618 start_codon:yes stop_codon:yes gene_type:complete
MNELIAVATITVLAVISPGPDFAMVTRNSYAFGSRIGLFSALGIACGVQVHVFYTMFGIAVLIVESPTLFMAMKIIGASYLIFLGYKSLTNKTKLTFGEATNIAPSPAAAFRMGFLTNALNPKTMLFVIATYTQVVQPDSTLSQNFTYGIFMSAAHWVWFSIVALFFAAPAMRKRILKRQGIVDKGIGIALIALGASLVFTKITA